MNTRTRRTAGLVAVATMAILTLTACIDVTYKLTVNSDATLSGAFTAAISKEAMAPLGVTSKEQLGEALTSGDMDLGVNNEVAQSCVESEDATNFIVTCTVANVQASELDDAWSLTKTGDELTLNVVSESQGGTGDEAAMPEGMSLGQFSFTATFPGPISSITGNGATKVDENTVTVAGSLSENFNVTVVASSEPSGSAVKLLILVLLAIAVLAVFAVAMVLLRKGKKQDAPAETAAAEPVTETPPTADSSDPSN
jgi:hypothetical protein